MAKITGSIFLPVEQQVYQCLCINCIQRLNLSKSFTPFKRAYLEVREHDKTIKSGCLAISYYRLRLLAIEQFSFECRKIIGFA